MTRQVFVAYDPEFEAGSLDEAYLDVTDYCRCGACVQLACQPPFTSRYQHVDQCWVWQPAYPTSVRPYPTIPPPTSASSQ